MKPLQSIGWFLFFLGLFGSAWWLLEYSNALGIAVICLACVLLILIPHKKKV